jgi:hypothetical protein
LEPYSQVITTNSFGAEAVLLGFLVLLVGLGLQSEAFERLVGSRVRGPFYLFYGAYGLPLILLLMEVQRRSPRRGGGISRFLIVLALVALLLILGVLALVAFLIYRYLRRRR